MTSCANHRRKISSTHQHAPHRRPQRPDGSVKDVRGLKCQGCPWLHTGYIADSGAADTSCDRWLVHVVGDALEKDVPDVSAVAVLSEWTWQRMSRTALCATFGISRQTGYKWARRYREERSSEEKSRRPQSHPKTAPKKLVERVLSLRRRFPLWGPVPIRAHLVELWPDTTWPSASTIGAILKCHGLVKT